MIFYDNGRFSLGSISFKLPNGVLLDLKDDEVMGEGFCLYAPDESFNIRIRCTKSDVGAYKSLSEMIQDSETGYAMLGEIAEVNCNGLVGYKAVYVNSSTLNEEYAFDLTDCGDYDLLNICITLGKRCKSFDEDYKNRIISEVLQSIEVQ